MRWPLRYQILAPFSAILLAGVALTAASASWLAARRAEHAIVAQLDQVVSTLGRSSFPYSQNVLQMMRGLSGAEFAALGRDGRVLASTLPRTASLTDALDGVPHSGKAIVLDQRPTVVIQSDRYFAARITRPRPTGEPATLLVLYPEQRLQQARREAALPPLAVGGITIVLLGLAAAWIARRMSGRIHRLQQQVAEIAAGRFQQVPLAGRNDEIQDLTQSVNQMSARLEAMQQTVQQTERVRLLGQLAGGLAHQLRNAATGARLALQIHRRRCPQNHADESLDIVQRQLTLMEEQVRGLLSLGKTERRTSVPCSAALLVDEIAELVGPACRHADVTLTTAATTDDCLVDDSGGVRTVLLNLVLNAVEAAGRAGAVELQTITHEDSVTFLVTDTGPGPPPELADSLFELFVTGKPEGVGIGLALAKQLADRCGGSVSWSRDGNRTRFQLILPARRPSSRAPRLEDRRPPQNAVHE